MIFYHDNNNFVPSLVFQWISGLWAVSWPS